MNGKWKDPAAEKLPDPKTSLKGSITIYLMLILVIVLVLICTLVESARVSAISLRAQSLAYMGADSVFSEYVRSIFDDYGIMVLWKDEDEFISEFEEYVESNLDISDLSYTPSASLYGISFTGSTLSSLTYITDDNGLIFAEQVYEYMDYYLAQSAAEKLLESLDIFSQADTVSAFVEKINSYSSVFSEVEEKVSAIKEQIEKIQKITQSPSSLLDELYETASSFEAQDVVSSEFSSLLTELKNLTSELESALEDIKESTQDYYESVEAANEVASELEAELLDEADELDEDIYDSVSSQLEELKSKSADTDTDYYEVGANEELTDEYLQKLESLESLFDALSDGLNEDTAADYAQIISQYQTYFEDFDLSSLGVNYDTSQVESEDSSILESINTLINKGVLAYVKDDISEKTIETDTLPSVTVQGSSSNSDESLADATVNKVIYGQYVLDHFGNAVNTLEDTALDYEVEYILAGKSSDLSNLKVVVSEIVALRSTLNFISILKDSAKKNEAYTLATAMVGFTGMPVLITLVQMLILTAWSAAEAIVDVKALLEGQKVPAIKSSDEWSLSIEGFKNFTGKDLEIVSCDSGLEYEDYLRVLLAMQSKQTQYYRTMDMIQSNVCLNENEDFLMARCICAVELESSFSANALFVSYAWVSSELSSYKGSYAFSALQSYEY